jgi:hypothetical protein
MLLFGGLCWFGFALGFAYFLMQYIDQGAGLQFFAPLGLSGSVLMGWIQVVGLCVAIGLCFVIGVGLCAHGVVPPVEIKTKETEQPRRTWSFIHHVMAIARTPEDAGEDLTLRCVRCSMSLSPGIHMCPQCGWTQPKR